MIWDNDGWDNAAIEESGLPVTLFGRERTRAEVESQSKEWLQANSTEVSERLTPIMQHYVPLEDDDELVIASNDGTPRQEGQEGGVVGI